MDAVIIERNDIPDDYLTALGRIAFVHSNLEFTIIYDIHLLIRKEYKETLCLIGGENFAILLSKLRRIFSYYVTDRTLLTQFDKLFDRIDDVNKDRANYMHSFWDVDMDGQVKFWKFSKRFKNVIELPKGQTVNLDDLNSLASRTEKVEDELRFFITKHMDYIHTEFDKRMKQSV